MNDDVLTSFEMKLGNEYYTKGIVGFKTAQFRFLPSTSGIDFTILRENNSDPIIGTYTYSVPSARKFINGKDALKDWYKRNFNLGEKIKVEILNDHKVMLRKL